MTGIRSKYLATLLITKNKMDKRDRFHYTR